MRPLHIVSFENDLDSLRLAMKNSHLFSYLRHSAPAGILENGRWASKTVNGISWELIEGAFPSTLPRAAPGHRRI